MYGLTRVFTFLMVWLIMALLLTTHETLFLQNSERMLENSYLANCYFQITLVVGINRTLVGTNCQGVLEELHFNQMGRDLLMTYQ